MGAPSPLSSKRMMKRQYLQRTPLCWQCSMSRRLCRAYADAGPHGFRAGWVSFVVVSPTSFSCTAKAGCAAQGMGRAGLDAHLQITMSVMLPASARTAEREQGVSTCSAKWFSFHNSGMVFFPTTLPSRAQARHS